MRVRCAQIRVQEQAQCLALGALPRSITVLLVDDLADCCRPGGAHLFALDSHLPGWTCRDLEVASVPCAPVCPSNAKASTCTRPLH